jgi:8-oxo-dGTP pyrophosphatase MutT (NUDIX family)
MEPEAAVAIVHARQPEESVLLMRRTERPHDSWSGHWSLPGGRRHSQDTDLLHTALRELEEECGIRLPAERAEAALPHVLARRRVEPYVLVAPFVFGVPRQLPTELCAEEAVESRWMPLSTLRDPARHAFRPVPGRPAELLFPAIAMGGTPLWGFTYRLLMDWLAPAAPQDDQGLAAANAVLSELLARGPKLLQEWRRDGQARIACVSGAIPVQEMVEAFLAPQRFLPAVNCLEFAPDRVRIIGPRFEDYIIQAAG